LSGPKSPPRRPIPPIQQREHVLVAGLGFLFFFCVFASLPRVATNRIPWRQSVSRALGSVGVDQYWPMFIKEDWDLPDLRILAVDAGGRSQDVTGTMLPREGLYEHVLDSRIQMGNLQLAAYLRPAAMDSYAAAASRRVGPEVRRIRFEAVYRTAKHRKTPQGDFIGDVIPLASYRRNLDGTFEKE